MSRTEMLLFHYLTPYICHEMRQGSLLPTVVPVLTYGTKGDYVTTPGYVYYALYRMRQQTES